MTSTNAGASRPAGAGGAPPAAYVAPMSHLDLTFMGSVEECLSRGAKVFTAVLDLLERQPDFRFFLEYVLFLEAYRALQPQQAARMDEHIRSGRVELGAEWSGIFAIEEEEEDLIRNVLYAKRYARERHGVELETLQMTDIPGSIPQLPQVCAKLGIRNLVLTRCAPADTLFWFVAPNGERVLTWSADSYNQAGRYGMHLGPDAMRQRELGERLSKTTEGGVAPLFYYGSDLYLPPPDLAPSLRAWREAGGAGVRLTTPTGYFRAQRERDGALESLPELRGELPSTWLYVEPDHAHVSRWDGIAAAALDAAERLSTLAWLRLGLPYPKQELETLWKAQLLARDHNYGGKGAGEGQPRKLAERREVYSRSRRLVWRAMGALAERVSVPRDSVPLLAFNTLNWDRGGVVRAHVTYYPGVDPSQRDLLPRDRALVLRGPDGETVPYQVTQDRRATMGEFDLAFVARDVPALGYAAYTLEPASEEELAAVEAGAMAGAPRRVDQRWFAATPPQVVIDNGLVRVAVSRATGRASIYDVRGEGAGALATGGSGTAAPMPGLRATTPSGPVARPRSKLAIDGLRLEGRHELPEVTLSPPRALSYDAPERETTAPAELAGDEPVAVVEQGPVLTTVAVRQRVMGAPAEVRYTVYRDLPWVDVRVGLDWDVREFGRVELVYGVPRAGGGVHYGLPFGAGTLDSQALMPGSGPVRGDEAPPPSWERTRHIARWLSVDDSEGGMAMATDHRWTRYDAAQPGDDPGTGAAAGAAGAAGFVRCALVRGGRIRPPSPDTDGDDPRIRLAFTFRFVPHSGSWRTERAPRLGWEAVRPLLSYTVNDTWSQKDLPRRSGLAAVRSTGEGDALVTCLKQSEDGEDVVVRWHEALGAPCEVAVEVPGVGRVGRVDLEERAAEADGPGGSNATPTPAWEIVTVRGVRR
ncbi:MAG TPA: glycosyl hydrolase-related protein [Chloroflexota bacterium]|nr:glycosyl hydrolase-related protein [Chloroflexota bacterium]